MTAINANMSDVFEWIPLSEADALAIEPGHYTIDDENIIVGGPHRVSPALTYTAFNGRWVDRAQAGSTAASHTSGATLTRYYPDGPSDGQAAEVFSTILTAPMLVGDLTAHVAAPVPTAALGFPIVIGSEILTITAGQGTTTWTVTRGVEGTTAAAHAGGAAVTHVLTAAGLAAAGTGWYDVTRYGATGDGSTNDTAAIQAAIAAITEAGKGTLYFPAGTYLTSGGFTISVPCTILGEGSAAWYNHDDNGSTDHVSQVQCSSATAVLFTVTATMALFRSISLLNVAATAPTAGAGIRAVYTTTSLQRVDYDGVTVNGFYDDVSIETGVSWTMRGCQFFAPVRYAVRAQNTVNSDAGDWSISDCSFWSSVYPADAAIRIESSGGKITNCKINSAMDANLFVNGIDIVFAAGDGSGVFNISNNSIENLSGHGINVEAIAAGAGISNVTIVGNEISLLGTNTTGYPISMEGGGGGAAGELGNVAITGNVFAANGAHAAVRLTKVNSVVIGNNWPGGALTGQLEEIDCYGVRDSSGMVGDGVQISGTPEATAMVRATAATTAVWHKLAYAHKTYAGGNLTFTSAGMATLHDDLLITLTPTNTTVLLIGWTLMAKNSTGAQQEAVTVYIDGGNAVPGSGTYGVVLSGGATNNQNLNLSGTIMVGPLTAVEHTFALMFRTDGGSATVYASSTAPIKFWVKEMA